MINSESLRKNRDFQLVYKKGTSYADRYIVVYVLENQLSVNRIGISVSKKVGNSVVRHRLKRLVKEAYRLHEKEFHKGVDIVVILRVNAKDAGYHDLENSLTRLCKKHRIMEKI